MKIINPNDHPIIIQIQKCQRIPDFTKKQAITDITCMIMNKRYREHTKFYTHGEAPDINSFMKNNNLIKLFSWNCSSLKHEFWHNVWLALRRG